MSGRLERLEGEIGCVADLTRDELVVQWQKMFKALPPTSVRRGLLERAAAYRLQARAFGGLKPSTHKRLLAIAGTDQDEHSAIGPDRKAERRTVVRTPAKVGKRAAVHLQPGTRLVREWSGTVHTVDVVDGGYAWNGESWTSLSAIARAITGARWSGPRFFGL